MSTGEKLSGYYFFKQVFNHPDTNASDKQVAFSNQSILERSIFELVLAMINEPSKLGQLRRMLVYLQEQGNLPEEFSVWAIQQVDGRMLSMALEYADDAESIIQILSFKEDTFNGLHETIENFYQQEKVSQRVYVRAKLLLRAKEQAQQ